MSLNLDEKPNFGSMLKFGERERNCISYLLQILEVKQRGKFITGVDGGPGMDTLENTCWRIAKHIEYLKDLYLGK